MINYLNIHDSTVFYENLGFKRIESPWTVSKYVSEITRPEEKIDYQMIHNKKVIVASGEQSFLYLYLKSFLPLGKFQTVTPCFRDELFDETHTKYFIKNELIITDDVSVESLNEVVKNSYNFFRTKLSQVNVERKKDGTIDLVYKGIELGSYGIRETNFLKWIYATGCAEPRLSYCQNLK